MNLLIRLLVFVLVVGIFIWLVDLLPLSTLLHQIAIVIIAVVALVALLEGFNGFSWRGPPCP